MAQISGLTPVDSLEDGDLLMLNRGFVSGTNSGIEKRISMEDFRKTLADGTNIEYYKSMYKPAGSGIPRTFGIAKVLNNDLSVASSMLISVDLLVVPFSADGLRITNCLTSSVSIIVSYSPTATVPWRAGLLHDTILGDPTSSIFNGACFGLISKDSGILTNTDVLVYVGLPYNSLNGLYVFYKIASSDSEQCSIKTLNDPDNDIYVGEQSGRLVFPTNYTDEDDKLTEELLIPRTPNTRYVDVLPQQTDSNTIYLVP